MKRQMGIIVIGLVLVLLSIGLFWIVKNGTGGKNPVDVEESSGFFDGNPSVEDELNGTDPERDKPETDKTETGGLKDGEASENMTLPSDGESGERPSSWRNSGEKHPVEETAASEEAEPVEEVKGPPKVMIASDLHVLARELTDGGAAFMKKAESDDGKTTLYSGEIVEAFLDEVLSEGPDALVLSGDLTFEGERLSHEELAAMLKKVEDAGIQVLVIPGNHDINNPRAASYFDPVDGAAEVPADPEDDRIPEKAPDGSITAEEFAEIYKEYGYQQAISRDENSLSYIYQLRDDIWLMMLDTNQYDPVNLVDGDIKPETYQWMIREFDKADEAGATVVPVGHHNILSVSRLYTRECMIESRASAIWLFGEHKLPLYLSGHLHVQRMKKYKTEPGVPGEAYGVHEIVTSSLGMTPYQYGLLTWNEERQIEYQARRVDVEGWAERIGSQDENLLDFNQYSREWYYHVVGKKVLKNLSDFPEDIMQDMAYVYADVLYHYGAGEKMDRREVESSRGYRMWGRFMPGDKKLEDIDRMLKDMEE